MIHFISVQFFFVCIQKCNSKDWSEVLLVNTQAQSRESLASPCNLHSTSPLLSSTMAILVHIWYSWRPVCWLEIVLCSRNPKVEKKEMQLSTFLSLLLSATCLLICLLLITVLPSFSVSFTSLPALIEHHSKVCHCQYYFIAISQCNTCLKSNCVK